MFCWVNLTVVLITPRQKLKSIVCFLPSLLLYIKTVTKSISCYQQVSYKLLVAIP